MKRLSSACARTLLRRSMPLRALLCVLLCAPAAFLHSQVTTKISDLAPTEATAGVPVTVSAQLVRGETVERAYLVYRPFGESNYARVEMELLGNTASATLPARVVQPPFVEYYIVLANRDGSLESYPVSESRDPFALPPQNTIKLTVRVEDETSAQVVFLSPEPLSVVAPDEVLISFSLLRADSLVVRRATQLALDGADVTPQMVVSGDIGVYAPELLAPGPHRASVRLFARDGSLYRVASISFTVRRVGEISYGEAAAPARYAATIDLESRHERVNEVGTWYNRGGYQFTGQAGDWRLLSNGYLTSEERSWRQPQNRFFIGVESSWLNAGYGDSYPRFPDLILSGKRVRGLSSGIHLGAFNVDLTMGTTTRAIDGSLVKLFPADSLSVEFARDSAAAYGVLLPGLMAKFSYGAYQRDLFIVRPSFGSGRTWQLGFTWMKSKDDVGSIQYGIRPQENLVVGSDFVARLDDSRIELTGQAAFSAYNSDISSGNFSDAQIDSLFSEKDRQTVKDVRDLLSKIITVNDNLRPLSLAKPSTLSYDLGLALNYFNNALKFTYLYRGSDYTSFGQTFLRKDIQGFNVLDRLRLVENQLYLSLGYERLQDNTSQTKVATTTFSTVNIAVSYFPRVDLPRLTVGFTRWTNGNGISAAGPKAFQAIDDNTNRIFLQSSYDFDLVARQTVTFNLSSSARDDQSIRDADVRSTSIGLNLISRFAIPLQTGLDLMMNLNTLPGPAAASSYRLDYTSLGLSARYGLIPDRLSVSAAVVPTFGDFTRTTLDAGLEWRALPTMSFLLDLSYFQNTGMPNDSFASLRYRYDL